VSGSELGAFLRARREALTPAEAGLPAGPRRRTPGLRRAEVAMLAGVSVEYLTRLEQGRDRHPSPQVVSALADTLRLSVSERAHLNRLAKGADGAYRCRAAEAGPERVVRPAVRRTLGLLEPTPAVLLNRLSDLLAWTAGYERLMGPLGVLSGDPPNLARYVFTDPRARAAFADWDRVADEQVAALKHGPFLADPHIAALAGELAAAVGDGFARRAESVPGLPPGSGVTRLSHPATRELRLAFETLDLPPDDGQRLLVYLPADDATEVALDALVRTGPRLPRAAG
jgi:transcriptional regulator with XRE-family HTH domain